MEKLIAQLLRLYIPAGAVTPERLERHILGHDPRPVELDTADGLRRAIAIPFDQADGDEEADAWTRLCAVARALQVEHGFPAPAVSVDGVSAYCLWISLEAPVPAAQAKQWADLVRASWLPGRRAAAAADAGDPEPQLPPRFNARGGRWAAFIHPGMGASFAGEPGLVVAPPALAQAAFLEELESVAMARFAQSLAALRPAPAAGPHPAAATATATAPATPADGLLLRDATLEDIVRHLHAQNIEPTFRHLLPPARQPAE